MKGISQLVVIVLILLIGISMASILYVWSTQTTELLYQDEAAETQYYRERACLGIEEITDTAITINNCGKVPLEDFKVYIDGINQNPSVPDKILPGDISDPIIITVPDGAKVYVTSDYAQTPVVTYNAIPNIDPIADFNYAQTELSDTVVEVQFTHNSTDEDGVIVSWNWNFGEGGSTSEAQNPSNQYANYYETYDVTLTVEDNSGGISTVIKQVTVSSANDCLDDYDCPLPYCSDCDYFFNTCIEDSGSWNEYYCDFKASGNVCSIQTLLFSCCAPKGECD